MTFSPLEVELPKQFPGVRTLQIGRLIIKIKKVIRNSGYYFHHLL